jgi:hypothetical protein|tara:strand:+ start:591 stop:737 length:147 start_codon:yes stop_codon:yes gene_type:complete
MNPKVIALLAKQEVQWESKFGRKISFEEAENKVTAKLLRLEKLNDFKY